MNLKLVLSAAIIVSLTACSNNPENSTKETTAPAAEMTAPESGKAVSQPAASEQTAQVSFKVNDTLARTIPNGSSDSEEQLGLYTAAVKSLSLSLIGDVPQRPHRGFLNFSIKDFKLGPAEYSLSANGNHASFTRYETVNAGGGAAYVADKLPVNAGSEMKLTITKMEKDTKATFGNLWLISGSFSLKLVNKVYANKRDSKEEVVISEGRFENVRLTGIPKE